jgi:hypothetical protein
MESVGLCGTKVWPDHSRCCDPWPLLRPVAYALATAASEVLGPAWVAIQSGNLRMSPWHRTRWTTGPKPQSCKLCGGNEGWRKVQAHCAWPSMRAPKNRSLRGLGSKHGARSPGARSPPPPAATGSPECPLSHLSESLLCGKVFPSMPVSNKTCGKKKW